MCLNINLKLVNSRFISKIPFSTPHLKANVIKGQKYGWVDLIYNLLPGKVIGTCQLAHILAHWHIIFTYFCHIFITNPDPVL